VEADATFTAYIDVDEVLRRSLAHAAEAAGARAACIVLHDAEASQLVVAMAWGPGGERARGLRVADDVGIAGAVLRSRQALVVPAPGPPADPETLQLLGGSDLGSLMAAPLEIAGRSLGVVIAAHGSGAGSFQATELERFVGSCGLIAVAVENASLYRRLHRESEILERSREDHSRPLIAESAAMRHALAQAERAAAGRSTVLLLGETGTGKEQVARLIHALSPRRAAPFVALNCGALPEGLLESELFGHEKGAFTGADRRRIGRFELADGGTFFLDEIGELPAPAQVKLLRVLQEHEISRVGGSESIQVDVRLVAATHRDLPAEVRAGRFREDLFFRIHVVPVRLPPLRERREDIEPLARLFLDRLARDLGRSQRSITAAALERLGGHAWPGNVRELENLVERLLVLGGEGPIQAEELVELLPDLGPAAPPARPSPAAGPAQNGMSLWEQERGLLVQALERSGQNQTRAARLLAISREQLRTRMKRHGLLQLKS
jgi:two-component system response regulator HydG